MKTKEVDQLINGHFKTKYGSGWYGFRVTCNLHEYGFSNMSPMSKQEYCKRIPKKSRTVRGMVRNQTLTYKAGQPRPSYDPLHCSWQSCPRLKELFKR